MSLTTKWYNLKWSQNKPKKYTARATMKRAAKWAQIEKWFLKLKGLIRRETFF
ncbi:MAG: hypothetical protein RLZZ628_1246 [Bacteroidota bacterium]